MVYVAKLSLATTPAVAEAELSLDYPSHLAGKVLKCKIEHKEQNKSWQAILVDPNSNSQTKRLQMRKKKNSFRRKIVESSASA